jgi:3'(2'), 5'-bisphosphate nucleotidase
MTDVSDADLAYAIATETGRLLLDLRDSYGDLSDPDHATALRKAGDRSAHLHIIERLAAARPQDTVLSEEGADDRARLTADRVWIVDPLDGTREYGMGLAEFAVHIALWERGELILGVVDLPGEGITHSSADIAPITDAVPTDRPIRFVMSRTRPPRELENAQARLREAFGVEVEAYSVGSAGAKTAELIAGRADVYLHDAGMSEWDLAAPAAAAAAAGLTVRLVDGSPLTYNNYPPKVGDLVLGVPVIVAAMLGGSRLSSTTDND